MSYDLFFRFKDGSKSLEDFSQYFSARPNYILEGTQALYHNEDTGVCFHFLWHTGGDWNHLEEDEHGSVDEEVDEWDEPP